MRKGDSTRHLKQLQRCLCSFLQHLHKLLQVSSVVRDLLFRQSQRQRRRFIRLRLHYQERLFSPLSEELVQKLNDIFLGLSESCQCRFRRWKFTVSSWRWACSSSALCNSTGYGPCSKVLTRMTLSKFSIILFVSQSLIIIEPFSHASIFHCMHASVSVCSLH